MKHKLKRCLSRYQTTCCEWQ